MRSWFTFHPGQRKFKLISPNSRSLSVYTHTLVGGTSSEEQSPQSQLLEVFGDLGQYYTIENAQTVVAAPTKTKDST